MSGTRQVKVVISGDASGMQAAAAKASGALGKTGTSAESVGHRIGGAFSKMGSTVGGEFGYLITSMGEGFDKLGEKGTSRLAKIAAAGSAVAGVGALLTGMGDKEKAASQQLDQAITNTGHTADEFKGQIERTVHAMEKYGDSAGATKTALMTLTNATHDPKRAIDLMGTAADLAAAKHIGLNDAASLLAKGLNGSTRVFKQYGIVVKTNADGTKDYAGAVDALAKVIHGQANAAADTLTGKLKALRTEVTDNVSAFGAKYGPAITAAGIGTMALAPLMGVAGKAIKAVGISFGTAGTEALAGAAEVGAADARIVAGNEAAAASARGVATAQGGMLARFGPVAAGVAAGAFVEAEGFKAATAQSKEHGKATGVLLGGLSLMLPGFGNATQAIEKHAKSFHLDNVVTGQGSIALDKHTQAALRHAGATGKSATATDVMARSLGTDVKSLGVANAAQDKSTVSLKAQTLQMQLANDAAGLLAQGFDKLNGTSINVEESMWAFRTAELAATTAVHDNGRSLNDNTVKGHANVAALLDQIKAAQAHAGAVGKQTGSTIKGTAAFRADVQAIRDHSAKLGLDRGAVDALLRKYGLMPKTKLTKIDVLDLASPKIGRVIGLLEAIHNITPVIDISNPHHLASGGTVRGKGTSTSDSNPYMLSIGEEVVREPYATQNRALLKAINSGRSPTLTLSAGGGVSGGASGGGSDDLHVHLYLDGQQVQQSLLRLKRQRGGNLGLN